jgi:arylsulfatase A-like enzyme
VADPAQAADQRARYAGEISFLDGCVGGIARALEARRDSEALLVTADHGEGLGEHGGYFGHDILLYDTAVLVPFLFTAFGDAAAMPPPARGIARDAAQTIDVAPTLAGLARLTPEAAIEGRDLLRERGGAESDTLWFETHPDPTKSAPRYALRTATTKVVWRPDDERAEFFDLALDPGETRDLGAQAGADQRALAAALLARLQSRPARSGRTVDDERGGVDDATRRALESLGYVNR